MPPVCSREDETAKNAVLPQPVDRISTATAENRKIFFFKSEQKSIGSGRIDVALRISADFRFPASVNNLSGIFTEIVDDTIDGPQIVFQPDQRFFQFCCK